MVFLLNAEFIPFSDAPGALFIQVFDLNGENGSAGATLIVVTPKKKNQISVVCAMYLPIC